MSTPLFGLLIEDRTPFGFEHFLGLLQAWLQDAGGFAAVGLVLYLVYALRTPPEQAESAKHRAGVTPFMLVMAVLAILAYAAFGFLLFTGKGVDTANVAKAVDPGSYVKYEPPKFSSDLQPLALMIGGLFAILGIGQPFVMSLLKVKFRRIAALSKLGFKEAIRSRLFWVFLIFLVPFLFPAKWFFPIKPEDELRTIIGVSSFAMQFLLLVVAVLLASFSIPNDIKNQNIYTVVTKPVERFEIVLGRFVGYSALMTLALIGMTLVSWGLIKATSLDPKAKAETYKAREPIRGKLSYQSRRGDIEGTNVGREFDYRRYIAGDPSSSQRAVWAFDRLPSGITRDRDHVPVEFTFDIFRMTKGEENRGVDLVVRVVSWQCGQKPPVDQGDGTWKWADAAKERQYQDDYETKRKELNRAAGRADSDTTDPLKTAAPPGPEPADPGRKAAWQAQKAAWDAVNQLAEKYGFYERSGKEIFDYHTDAIAAPVGVFQNALKDAPKADKDGRAPPLVAVYVKCNTRGQLLGMAEADLYLLSGERSFDENYFKASVGLWCRVIIVIGIAVCCSTYLAGVISLLMAGGLYLAGYAGEHLQDLAQGSYVGGPFRAMNQLLKAEQPTAVQDPSSAFTRATEGGDVAFSWLVRRFVNIVPDPYTFEWTDHVGEGFNISPEYLVMNVLVMIAYLLPWFILGYYLMRSREVAA
jgi:hypothetical protein